MQHLSKVYRRGSKNKTLRTHHETGKTFSKDITTSVNKYMTKQLNLKELSNCVINIQHFSTSLTTCVHICAYTYIYIYVHAYLVGPCGPPGCRVVCMPTNPSTHCLSWQVARPHQVTPKDLEVVPHPQNGFPYE